MRTKLCWIPFIPITLIMLFLKYMETTLSPGDTFMGLDVIGIRYTVIILVPVLFVLCFLISLFDKKTSPFYTVSKNIFAATFSFIAAIAIMFKSVMSIMNILSTGNIAIIDIVTAIIGIIAGIGILFMASCHLSGKNYAPSLGVLMLFPALWAAFELIVVFLSYTTISVLSKDMLDLVCYSLISLFLFTVSMVLGSMEGKNPVKRCFIFGMPAIAATFSYTIFEAVTYINIDNFEFIEVAKTVSMFAIGLYALSVIIELTVKANKKDEVVLIDSNEELDEHEQTTVREEVDYLLNESGEKKQDITTVIKEETVNNILTDLGKETISPAASKADEETHFEEASAIKQEESKETSPKEENSRIPDLDFVIAPKEEERNNSKSDLDSRMDQIDRLIFEIQSNQDRFND